MALLGDISDEHTRLCSNQNIRTFYRDVFTFLKGDIYIYINIDRNEFDSPFVSFPKDINRIIEIKLIGNDRYWTSSSMRFRIINCTYGSSMNNRAQRQLHRMKDLKYLE